MIINKASPLVKGKRERKISQSALNTLGLCRRRFHWSINERLEPDRPAAPLSEGTMWHKVMATHYANIGENQPESYTKGPSVSAGDPLDHIWAWAQERDSLGLDAEETQKKTDMYLGIYQCFINTFVPLLDQQAYEVVAIEHTIERKLNTWAGSPSSWVMVGTPDLIVRDRETNELIVVDHKTTAGRREGADAGLDMNFQCWDYAWLSEKEFGEPVKRVMFQRFRKRTPSIPKPLKSGEFSTKRMPDTTQRIFLKTLSMAGVDDFSPFSEIMRTLAMREDDNGTSFIWRSEARLTDGHLKQFESDAYSRCLDVAQERRWSPNYDACDLRERRCQFKALCMYGDGPLTRRGFIQRAEGHFIPSMSFTEETEIER